MATMSIIVANLVTKCFIEVPWVEVSNHRPRIRATGSRVHSPSEIEPISEECNRLPLRASLEAPAPYRESAVTAAACFIVHVCRLTIEIAPGEVPVPHI